MSYSNLLNAMKSCVPPLTSSLHKGQCGRIAVIGGSPEFAGAPYFAGIAALRVGADYVKVFCPEVAAPVIKSFSPDLVVHPILNNTSSFDEIKDRLSGTHSMIIGPGLGRRQETLDLTKKIITYSKEMKIPIVIDADGIIAVHQTPDIVRNHGKVLLTPNAVEYDRLIRAIFNSDSLRGKDGDEEQMKALCTELKVCIFRKQDHDKLCDGEQVVDVEERGSYRRCAGQGDILGGCLSVFMFWANAKGKELCERGLNPNIVAAYAGSFLVRKCASTAFSINARATITSDLINLLGKVFSELFEH